MVNSIEQSFIKGSSTKITPDYNQR